MLSSKSIQTGDLNIQISVLLGVYQETMHGRLKRRERDKAQTEILCGEIRVIKDVAK